MLFLLVDPVKRVFFTKKSCVSIKMSKTLSTTPVLVILILYIKNLDFSRLMTDKFVTAGV